MSSDINKFEQACQMWRKDAKVLEDLTTKIDAKTYEAVLNMLKECKGRIATLGMGTSSVAARKIAHMLCVANIPSYFVSAGDAAHGAFGSVQEGDVLIILSRGGETEELVNLIEPIKGKKLKSIVVTKNASSKLAKAADVVLIMDIEESDCRHRLPTASILAIVAFFDAIADAMTHEAQFNDEVFYYNHNHGAVGTMLKNKN